MKKQKSASFWVAIALILCLISSLGASMVQTGGGAIKYHDITMVTDSGHELDALLLVPKNATRENPAPAIVTSHGWYNNREMQDLNYVEYARRGYVVISISMYGHGDSEVIPDGTWWDAENNANGLYDAVKYIARLPYVDASRIGVTGHSNGALASRVAVMQDEEGLITFFNKGFLWSELTHLGGSITGIWLYPIVFILPLAVFVFSKIYKKSKNPYIGGIIMGILACVVSVTNTLTLG